MLSPTMSKSRFILMSLLPNLLFGCIPYSIGLLFPRLVSLTAFGIVCIGIGFGDYYNVFNMSLDANARGVQEHIYII